MPTEQRYRLVTSALKALFFFFSFVSFSFSHAASLGRLTLLSSLGQPLRAEVELLSVSPDEAQSLAVGLSPVEAYKRSGIDDTSFLQSLTVSLKKEGDRHFVSIHSAQSLNEPYLGILLELSVNGERKGREYSIALDPAEWTNLRSAPLSTSASTQKLSRQHAVGRQFSGASPAAARPSSVVGGTKPSDEETASSAEYVVSRGDTLSKIAERLGRRDVSLDQMLVALYRNNPDAFLDNNMNRLRKGAVLSVPDASEADKVSQQEAQRVVRLHSTHFRRYSQKLAGMVQKGVPGKAAKRGVVAEGRISTSVREQPAPADKLPDRLELSKARPETAPAGITPEEKIAINKAIEDANARIAELEKNVNELRSLLAIVSKNGNALTKPAEISSEAEKQTTAPGASGSEANVVADKKSDVPRTETGTVGKTASSEPDGASAKEGVDPGQTLDKAGEKAAPQKKKDARDDEDEDEDESEAKKKQGFLYNLKNNRVWHIAIGAATAFLALIAFVMRGRRRKQPVPAPGPAAVPSVAAPAPQPKEEEYVNPNIISGRDFLENLTGRRIEDDEDDDEDGSYRAMKDDEDEENEPEAVQPQPEDDARPEEIVAEPETEPEAEPEAEPETAFEKEPGGEAISPGDAQDEAEDVLAQEEKDAAAPDTVRLRLDDGDEPTDEMSQEEEEAKEQELPSLDLDLSDITLEPDVGESEDLPDMARAAGVEEPEPYNAEMAAKLELALAYLGMKDKEGARELLEEVIARGTPGQVMEAQQAMQSL